MALPVRADPLGQADPTLFVDPMIGTGGHGHVFPGATVPFGMIQLSPDTDNARWEACSGYYYDDETLLGFSHTHLSGTGASDMMDLLVVPFLGETKLSPGTLSNPEGSYRTRMSHEHEVATPGYYSLILPDSGIRAELTATARAGLHRYTFPAGQRARILLDWTHGYRDRDRSQTLIASAQLQANSPTVIAGSRRVLQWANGRHIHFALRLSQPFESIQYFENDQPVDDIAALTGRKLKAVLDFGVLSEPLIMKVGVSAVDIPGALNNLDLDLPHWDFEAVRGAARALWAEALSPIRIETGNEADRRIFTTALYHAHMAPTLFSDRDGRYRGMDGQLRNLAPGEVNYSTYSLWDTYRTWHPLMTILAPDRAAAFTRNLIDQGLQSPAGPCIWPLQGVETYCMIGWHSAVVIAEALNKGLPGIDAAKAWSLYSTLAFQRNEFGLDSYRAKGFIPADVQNQSVSKTIEYSLDDWAMAHIAKFAGARTEAQTLRQRSGNYRNVFDAKTQFMRPRLKTGRWAEPFDPRAMGHNPRWWDYCESNAWQATFGVQHDVYGAIALFGGDAAFEARLDSLFAASSELLPGAPPDMDGMIGQYIHGNEPSHHIAYLYAYAGTPWKTQAMVRKILREQYRDGPDGMSGNEDCGQMSAWYIMSALGFYPVDPVSGTYVFGAPLFPVAEVQVGENVLRIVAEGVDSGPYIQSITRNGEAYTRSWISHADVMSGGELRFVMGAEPNQDFGRDLANRPPSFV
ncbi:alpha-1,2-mannosidase [Asticcacaulis sp. AC460]|uniref:GH92 family glycosyl hydrolase n=1 Tax=Asticcacaulis sp. AC460 TaxID=1282360 RepID=UPI0003C3D471|nr:GH92 family glycosyl hydrolase [Asticcacaulis sp. AC460]ESQ87474.1 alpha-1,2-mannosidase [Asticcacaulis sp. AC460]